MASPPVSWYLPIRTEVVSDIEVEEPERRTGGDFRFWYGKTHDSSICLAFDPDAMPLFHFSDDTPAYLYRPEANAHRFAVAAEHDPPLRRAMLELDLIYIGATRPNAGEGHRLQRTQLRHCSLQLRQLLASDVGKLRAHLVVVRFSSLQFLYVAAQSGFGSR